MSKEKCTTESISSVHLFQSKNKNLSHGNDPPLRRLLFLDEVHGEDERINLDHISMKLKKFKKKRKKILYK